MTSTPTPPSELTGLSHTILKVNSGLSPFFHSPTQQLPASSVTLYAASDMDFALADPNTILLDFDEFDTPANAPTRGLEFAVETSGNGGSGGGGSGTFVCSDMSDEDDGGNDDDDYDFHAPVRSSTSFVAVDPSEDLEPALELAVDADGNGGGGGGGGNVVCTDMFDDDNSDDDNRSTNPWTRENAIKDLQVEFWMHHPNREPGESAQNCENICVEPDHPRYGLYLQVLGLIEKNYDKIGSEGDFDMVREIKARVELAWNEYHFGYEDSWAEYLPSRAELMFTRFVVPHDGIDRSIVSMLGDMGCLRMFYIDDEES
ncbi:hypothetical protein Neosp_011590 [[Neocosmospora] mangrovei]